MSKDKGFKIWLKQVNKLCMNKFDLSIDDLPDMLTRDAYDAGISPEDFFEEDVMTMMQEEYGELIEQLDGEPH